MEIRSRLVAGLLEFAQSAFDQDYLHRMSVEPEAHNITFL